MILCSTTISDPSFEWEAVQVSTNSPNLIKEIESKLYEEEWIASEWSPIHLKELFENFYQGWHISCKCFKNLSRYMLLPLPAQINKRPSL